MASLILITLITGALIVIAMTTTLNVFTMFRVGQAPPAAESPFVSVLIPARNEAHVIGQTIHHLREQSYPHFEVVLLDDNSTDSTAEQARAAAGDLSLRVISGAPLPDGWAGKNWACHQLSQQARGDCFIFTDADVRWASPQSLQAVVNTMQYTQADLLTVWSTQHTVTWGERLVVPLMAFVILGYLPHLAVNHIPWAVFAAANGQCMAFRRKAYRAVGGHETVKDEIVEDIRLGQKIKVAGYKLRMADGAGLVSCRMYDGWAQVRDGYAKNIIAGYGDSILGLLAGALFHWLVFLLPYAWLVQSTLAQNWQNALWAVLLIVITDLTRALSAAATKQRPWDALLMPVSVLLMTRIAAQGIWWYARYGGPRWKDRTIVKKKKTVGT